MGKAQEALRQAFTGDATVNVKKAVKKLGPQKTEKVVRRSLEGQWLVTAWPAEYSKQSPDSSQ